MKVHWNSKGRITLNSKPLALCTLLFAGIFLLWMLYPDDTSPGPYTDSAHGSSSYGVKRSSTTDYSQGNCAHCHEQHASIGGSEPAPTGGASKWCIFANNFNTSKTTGSYIQSDLFCFYCHYGSGTYQSTSFNNYTYSITFGGNPDTTPNNIFDAFNSSSYHNLYDIWRFITGQAGSKTFSDFPMDSNPCSGCHNVHIAKKSCGKPSGSFDPSYSAISKPSDHSNLWGDDTTERMNSYNYKAPYWYGSTTTYEPANNSTSDGSNLPNYVAFCTDCHSSTNSVPSQILGSISIPPRTSGYLRTIDWANEKHGQGAADTYVSLKSPYSSPTPSNYVTSCTDCHEPHGAPNAVLIRKSVNGSNLAGSISLSDISTTSSYCPSATLAGNKVLGYLCRQCHKDDNAFNTNLSTNRWCIIHHNDARTGVCGSSDTFVDAPYPNPSSCNSCHTIISSVKQPITCSCCHYHGSQNPYTPIYPFSGRTF